MTVSAETQAYQDGMNTEMDKAWTMMAGTLVFFMHAGFSLLEAGYVQRKNQQGILVKNLLAICIGGVMWFLIGYGLAWGKGNRGQNDNPDAEGSTQIKGGFAGSNLYWADEETLSDYTHAGNIRVSRHADWWFQYTFCATAATIVSGAVAERITLLGFSIYTALMTAFIYPCVVHWTWNGGLLAYYGYNDFAGSGTVHMTGGWAALAGAAIIGPRNNPGKPSSMLLVTLGTFILWFGWYGFNAGSTTSWSGGKVQESGKCAMNTTLSAAAGGLSLFMIDSYRKGRYDVSAWCNGVLAGLVGITAGCNIVDPAAAILIGICSGPVCELGNMVLERLGVDDPVGAFPVHGMSGAWGVIAAAVFDLEAGQAYGYGYKDQLEANLQGVLLIVVWSGGISGVIFLLMRGLGVLRVSEEVEEAGVDSEFANAHCSGVEEQ